LNDRDRLGQLRGLLDRLERMPASADRDWMLAEVRGRAVDVETGVRPASVRALPQQQASADHAIVAPKRARVRTPRPAAPQAPPARPVVVARTPVVAVRTSAVDLLEQGGLLCLGDPPADAGTPSRPWCAGLRG
jgi:hypothetical protein